LLVFSPEVSGLKQNLALKFLFFFTFFFVISFSINFKGTQCSHTVYHGTRVIKKNQKIKADISLLNCVLINPELVRVISSQARSFPPSLGIYFELHSAEMYAVIFKARFLAIVLPYRDKLFK
jgi:hypothetical protein